MDGAFGETARSILANPPVHLDHLDRIVRLIAATPHAVSALHDPATPPAAAEALRDTLLQLRETLLFTSLCDSYHAFFPQASLSEDHPGNGCMLVFVATAYIHAAVPPPTAAADRRSMGDLFDEMRLLNMRWAQQQPGPALAARLEAMLRRALLITASPGTARVFDVPKLRKATGGTSCGASSSATREPLFTATWDAVRRFSGGLVRMFCVARWVSWGATSSFPIPPSPGPAVDGGAASETAGAGVGGVEGDAEAPHDAENVMRALVQQARALDGILAVRKNLGDLFPLTALGFGDYDVFVERRNADPQHARAVVYTVKPPEAQQAWANLPDALSVLALCEAREDDPHFWDLYTAAHRVHIQNAKLFVAEGLLRTADRAGGERRIRFRLFADWGPADQLASRIDSQIAKGLRQPGEHDIFVPEQAFVQTKFELMTASQHTPLLLQLLGGVRVFFQGRLHWCASTEAALLLWATLVLQKCGGRVNGMDITPGLRALLNEAPVFSATDEWRDAEVVAGDAFLE